MSDLTAAPSRTGRGLLVWAVTATVLAVVFFNLTLFFYLRSRQAGSGQAAGSQYPAPANPGSRVVQSGESAFANLPDSDVVGRYRYYELTNLMGTIKLLPDHTIINKDGTTYPRYYWEIQPDGILTRWQRADVIFNVREAPGVYVARRRDGVDYRRIEKIDGAVDK